MNFDERSIDRFLSDVASENVTPAGGTAAAVVGATGAALCEMVCIHTAEPDDAEVAAELDGVREDLRQLRRHLLELATADAEAVDALLEVRNGDAFEAEAKRTIGVPLAIAEACLSVLEHATVATAHGNPNAVPDAVTGAFLAHAALRASAFTVRSNLDYVEDSSFVEESDRRAAEVERSAERAFEQVLENGGNDP